jgi:UDP-N-acetyl-alpha-D-muramoyl-L-alanyl-L-glutamate epimerase
MGKSIRHDKFLRLREEFPFFVYESFDFTLDANGLEGVFHFRLGDRYYFSPSFFIPRRAFFLPDEMIRPQLPSLVFHIGMIELVSYWKAACPPVVEVKAGGLTKEQGEWWKDVYFKGFGEFFFLNGIHTGPQSFMNFSTSEKAVHPQRKRSEASGILIPVGGGKDSVVTLELLGKMEGSLPLVLNPTEASRGCLMKSGFDEGDVFEIRRMMDPQITEMNQQGFLNGHTPFSALLAFYTLLAAAVSGKRYIALSNESSANEPTIPGTEINHQYSKSFEFEDSFRDYVNTYLSEDTEYFSFLRPLHEIQIARLFSKYTGYHGVFRSCNAGSKTGSWCGKCSKCLFTYIILSPFLSEEALQKIFGKELFSDPDLTLYFDQLTGIAPEKPFDCVGTTDEVNAAVREAIRLRAGKSLPLLLERYAQHTDRSAGNNELNILLSSFDLHHHLPPQFLSILKKALHG